MSKRKRPTPKEGGSSTPAEGSEGEPSVHVGPDLLAGSPDTFARGKGRPAEEAEPAAMSADEAPAESPAPVEESASVIDEAATATTSEALAAVPAAPIAAITPPLAHQPAP